MTQVQHIAQRLAAYLLEGDEVDYYAKVFADRLILRVYNVPSLTSYMRGVAILDSKQDGVPENSFKFQLKFKRLPPEIIPQVKQLIAVPKVRVVEFDEDHASYTGFEFTLTREDLDFSQTPTASRDGSLPIPVQGETPQLSG